ncbi:methyl-accepting chemotaxis protein [bacterium]|nr:methyl-accepting chemotaxis protein [bacterium]
MQWRDVKIESKLVTIMLSLGLCIAIAVGCAGGWIAYKGLESSIRSNFEAVRDIRASEIKTFYQGIFDTAEALAGTRDVTEMTEMMVEYQHEKDVQPTDPFPIDTEEYVELWKRGYTLEQALATFGYYDIFIISKAHGHVMYTVCKEKDLGENLSTGYLKDSGLGKCWKAVVETGKPAITEWEPYEPSNNVPAQFIGVPIIMDGEFKHVFAIQVPQEKIDEVMQSAAGMGTTGETYMVGQDKLIQNNSRLEHAKGVENMLKQEVDTPAVAKALAGETGFMQTHNYEGETCLTAYSPFEFEGLSYAVIAEITLDEAYRPIRTLVLWIVVIVAIVAVLTVIIAIVNGRAIGRPLQKLASAAQTMADGDFTVEITSTDAKDEVGLMSSAFLAMKDATRRLIQNVMEAATNVASASEELSAGADETGRAVQEVSQTVQQVAAGAQETTTNISQARQMLNQNATAVEGISRDIEDVAAYATQAAAQGEEGRQAADNAVGIINRATDSVRDTTNVVQQLGEKTDQIAEFIGIITGIADQTNLLALNAAIEAARAGEAGRGFAVVAEEVRKLAEESNHAAGNITDLVRAIGAEMKVALEAMSKSDKEVAEGANTVAEASRMLSEIVGGVQALNDKVQNISAAAEQINASTGEVVNTMGNIASVAEENSAATEEVSSATEEQTASMEEIGASANQLAKLAQDLQAQIAAFKV